MMIRVIGREGRWWNKATGVTLTRLTPLMSHCPYRKRGDVQSHGAEAKMVLQYYPTLGAGKKPRFTEL